MTRPNNEAHRQYYDGYKREYNFGYLLGVDGITGECRYFNGHLLGAQNDLNNYYSSGLYNEPALYFGLGDKVLADGIFARIDENRFIVPVCGVSRELTAIEQRYNMVQRKARSIIEHYNSRLKLGCPILRYFSYSINKINPIFTMCLTLTNIRIKYQDPLRIW